MVYVLTYRGRRYNVMNTLRAKGSLLLSVVVQKRDVDSRTDRSIVYRGGGGGML